MIEFSLCIDSDSETDEPSISKVQCKTRLEIEEKLQGANLVLMNNMKRFESLEYLGDSIKAESVITWHPINTDVGVMEYYKLTKIEIDL